MLYSKVNTWAFVHVPKNAGISVEAPFVELRNPNFERERKRNCCVVSPTTVKDPFLFSWHFALSTANPVASVVLFPAAFLLSFVIIVSAFFDFSIVALEQEMGW